MSSTKNLYIEKINNTILIFLDKFIKYVIYILIIKNLNAEDFANLI